MATWDLIKFYYKNMLANPDGTLTATSTLSGTDVANIYNMLEINRWKAADSTDPHFIYYDGNLLLNPSFESWTGGVPDNWIVSGTVTQETATVKSGSSSAKLTRSGGIDASIHQSIPDYRDYIGKTFTAGFWCYASAPNQARLAIWDNTWDVTYAYHSGSGSWEFITATHVVSERAVDLRIYLQVIGTDGDAYFDYTSAGPAYSADYLAILGHNLWTIDAGITLECSPDNFITPYMALAKRPTSDNVLLVEAPLVIGDFEVWPYGATASPAGWTKNGSSTIDKETNASYIYSGKYSVKLTNQAGNEAYIESNYYNNSVFQNISYWRGKTLSFGCWIKANDANRVRVEIYDDGGSSASAYHTGGGGWEFLSVTRTIDANTTTLRLRLSIEAGASSITAWFDEAKAVIGSSIGSSDTSDFIPAGLNAMRHWRLRITDHTAPPEMAICIWGDKTELDYARVDFDPNAQEAKANINVGQTGYLLGIHRQYTERSMSIRFPRATQTLYDRITEWWEISGLNNFFVAWNLADRPEEVYLMRPDKKFKNPLVKGGLYRDITINLVGRKE